MDDVMGDKEEEEEEEERHLSPTLKGMHPPPHVLGRMESASSVRMPSEEDVLAVRSPPALTPNVWDEQNRKAGGVGASARGGREVYH